MRYDHVQTSPLWLLVSIPLLAITASAASEGVTSVVIAIAGFDLVLIAVVANFSRMRVTVSDVEITASFGRGWPRRSVTATDITAVEIVRNRWFWGWGKRAIPGGWMWNLRGLDAGAVSLRSGRTFRIGTDDPQGLHAATLSVAARP